MKKVQVQFNEESKEKHKGKLKDLLSKLSRGLMLPVAMLPIAGMLLGVGSAFTSKFDTGTGWNIFGEVLSYPGSMVFSCLPMFFAITIAIAFTKEAGPAGLIALLGWVIFCSFQHALIIPVNDASGNVVAYNFLFYHYDMTDLDSSKLFTSVFRTDGNVGILALSTSVFGGMTVGGVTAYLYNKFKNTQLPNWIGFFSGVKFVPVVAFPVILILSLLFCMLWPVVGQGLFNLGGYMSSAPGGLNVFAIQMVGRSLIPFGLHFVVNALVNYSSLGGSFDLNHASTVFYNNDWYVAIPVNVTNIQEGATWKSLFFSNYSGTVIDGQVNINNQLLKYLIGQSVNLYRSDSAGHIVSTNISATVPLSYDMIFKGTFNDATNTYSFVPCQYSGASSCVFIFGLPAAALAMMHCVPKGEERKKAGSILISAAIVSALCGISEPIEFTFLFVAPLLFWGIHCVLNALMCMIGAMLMLYTNIGPFVYGACVIDILAYSLIPEITTGGGVHIWVALLIGVGFTPIYYIVFKFMINRFNYATPGRNGNEVRLFTKKDFQTRKDAPGDDRINKIIKGLGGKQNIVDIGACMTRLRVNINNKSKVNENLLKETGALGFAHPSSKSIQVIYGPQADAIKGKVKDQLDSTN